jgi:hypothetical protein
MLEIQQTGAALPTLLGRSGRATLLGPAPDFGTPRTVLNEFLAQLLTNQNATFYVSKGEGSGAGEVNEQAFAVIPTSFFEAVNVALDAAGKAKLLLEPLTDAELFVPDAGMRLVTLTPALITHVREAIAQLPSDPVATGKMPMKTKVLIGVGLVVLVAGVATIALSPSLTSPSLAGARRRKRRRS